MPTPGEHKTVQVRILLYAQDIGWRLFPRGEAEQRRGVPPSLAGKEARRIGLSHFFDDPLYQKVRQFNPLYAEAPGALVGQLRRTVLAFEQTAGMVQPITEGSRQLKESLELGKIIITTTLQKFPVISEQMRAIPGKHFAIIIDEAHSSQSGESIRHLNKVLAAGSFEEAEQLTPMWKNLKMKSLAKSRRVANSTTPSAPQWKPSLLLIRKPKSSSAKRWINSPVSTASSPK